MAKQGISLHIGLNSVEPNAYNGWSGPLNACEADASDMEAIAKASGFKSTLLLTPQATRKAVIGHLSAAVEKLEAGDMLWVTFSGHGSQVPDKNNDEESDGLDETWCLFDGQLVDDELFMLWSRLKPDTRVLVLSDSCHSGTVLKHAPTLLVGTPASRAMVASDAVYSERGAPPEIASRAYRAQKALYDSIQKQPRQKESDIKGNVLLISGCQDNQTSLDGPFNGAFTSALLRVWRDGAFQGTYRTLHKRIQQLLPSTQQPNLMTVGYGKPFTGSRPFTI